jgi:hypothetical protein
MGVLWGVGRIILKFQGSLGIGITKTKFQKGNFFSNTLYVFLDIKEIIFTTKKIKLG